MSYYSNGLEFECQRCRYCCSSEPGYVFLSEKDLDAAALASGLDREAFISIYCRLVDFGAYYLISLKEKENYDCIFLNESGCSIYSGRPTQCRTYPFWSGIVDSEKAWREESKLCPGIGKGRKISKEEIEERLKSDRENNAYVVLKKKF